jgi:shikimate 5-dehydrogenase
MGMLASTLLAAGLGIGGTAIAAGPAAADTGLQSVTVSAENYQSYTDNYNRDRDRDHRNWCERHGHWHYYHHHWYWQSDCDRGRIH